MSSIRVTCINKDGGDHDDPYEAITHLGWVNESTQENGKYTLSEMIDFLEDNNSAYVKDIYGNRANLVVRLSQHNNKYVRTISDGFYSDNLLKLMECK